MEFFAPLMGTCPDNFDLPMIRRTGALGSICAISEDSSVVKSIGSMICEAICEALPRSIVDCIGCKLLVVVVLVEVFV